MTMTLSGSGTITGLVAGGLPDATITQPDLAAGVAGNGPAFNAWMSGTTTVSNLTATKVPLNSEDFDTANCFDTTNYRFTPNVAGYYQFNAIVRCVGGTNLTSTMIMLYKNGNNYSRLQEFQWTISGGSAIQMVGSTCIYLNGTTDYIELYAQLGGSGTLQFVDSGTQYTCRFSGALVRAA